MRPNALTRQHAEEAAINALVMQRDALSREFAQLQNAYDELRTQKDSIEARAQLISNETKKLEILKTDLIAETQQLQDTIQDIKEDIKIQERSAENMKKATDAVRRQRDIAVANMDQVEEEYAQIKKEHQETLQKLRDDKALLLGEIERLKDTKQTDIDERQTLRAALDLREQSLVEREEIVKNHLESAWQLDSDTKILRARLKNLAETHICDQCGTATPIHFSIKL